MFVAIGHELQDIVAGDLVHERSSAPHSEKFVERVAAGDVGSFFAVSLNEIKILVNGLTNRDALVRRQRSSNQLNYVPTCFSYAA